MHLKLTDGVQASTGTSMSMLVWLAHGSPSVEDIEVASGTCWFCGGPLDRGRLVSKWAGPNFNSWSRARSRHDQDATHICRACIYITSRISPVLGRPPKPGKKYGGNFRNYSHCAEAGGRYLNASKAQTDELVDWISGSGKLGQWGVSIAVSGQKHVIPTTPINPRGATVFRVAFEDQVVRVDRCKLLELISEMNQLRQVSSCSGKAIASGDYHHSDFKRGLDAIRTFESRHSGKRGGGAFELAAFLTSKAT